LSLFFARPPFTPSSSARFFAIASTRERALCSTRERALYRCRARARNGKHVWQAISRGERAYIVYTAARPRGRTV
jgi:hypothetical protein